MYYENETKNNIQAAIRDLVKISEIAKSQMVRCDSIPILDDGTHADYVQGYADRIHEIMMDMEDLANFGYIKG